MYVLRFDPSPNYPTIVRSVAMYLPLDAVDWVTSMQALIAAMTAVTTDVQVRTIYVTILTDQLQNRGAEKLF